jgi:spore maturation protein A
MVNIVWSALIILGIIYSIIVGKVDVINIEILLSAKNSIDMVIKLLPIMAIWLGIMEIAKDSGFLKKFSAFISPILGKLFPDIPKEHESLGFIASNMIANMFGLGNAATPFGLKAMKSLQELNKKKDTASRSMITFLVLNTSGLTIIPTTVISMRLMHGSTNPTEILVPCFIATFFSTMCGLILDRILARRHKDNG